MEEVKMNTSDIISLLSIFMTLGMMIATCWVAISTRAMAKATNDMLEAQSKPRVVIYPRQSEDEPTIFQLIIENIGTVPAYDIRFNLSENFYIRTFGIETIDKSGPEKPEYGVFKTGISCLPPGLTLAIDWGQYGAIRDSLGGNPAKIIITYKSAAGKIEEFKTDLNIVCFEGINANKSLALRSTKALENNAENTKKLSSIIEDKVRPYKPRIVYKYSYLSYLLLKDKGVPERNILPLWSEGFNLPRDQRELAQKEAEEIFNKYNKTKP